MIPQINLYQPQFRRKHLRLSFSRMVMIGVATLLVIPLQAMINLNEIDKINNYANNVQQDYIKANFQWGNLQSRFAKNDGNQLLTAKEKKLKTILNHRAELLHLITDSQFVPHKDLSGYSAFMIAFARQHSPDLWLTNVDIVNNGDQIMIEGRSLNAQAIPDYLNRLSSEPILTGTQLEILKIDHGDSEAEHTGLLHFSLATYRDDHETGLE